MTLSPGDVVRTAKDISRELHYQEQDRHMKYVQRIEKGAEVVVVAMLAGRGEWVRIEDMLDHQWHHQWVVPMDCLETKS